MKKIIVLILLVSISLIANAQNMQWNSLGQGADTLVTTIDSHDSIIFISGPFSNAFGFAANNFGLYVNGKGVNPGTGFTGGYANSFINYGGTEYAGGNFKGYFNRFNWASKTWDSVAPINSPVIQLDTFQNKIVIATDSSVYLLDTSNNQIDTVPQKFKGLLTCITVFQNKIWIAAYANKGDTLSNLYTYDGDTVGDSTLGNRGIKCLYTDNIYLLVSGREVGGANNNDVAIYSGGKFSELSDNWNYILLNVGFVNTIAGNFSSGYILGGSFVITDGDGNYHTAAIYKNGVVSVLGNNLSGTAYGSCLNSQGIPVLVGDFTLSNSTGNFNVVIQGEATGIPIIHRPQISLFPNPFNSWFTVKNVNVNSTYSLYDVLGRLITSIKPAGSEILYQDANIDAGIYFLKENEHPENVIKIIKQ